MTMGAPLRDLAPMSAGARETATRELVSDVEIVYNDGNETDGSPGIRREPTAQSVAGRVDRVCAFGKEVIDCPSRAWQGIRRGHRS